MMSTIWMDPGNTLRADPGIGLVIWKHHGPLGWQVTVNSSSRPGTALLSLASCWGRVLLTIVKRSLQQTIQVLSISSGTHWSLEGGASGGTNSSSGWVWGIFLSLGLGEQTKALPGVRNQRKCSWVKGERQNFTVLQGPPGVINPVDNQWLLGSQKTDKGYYVSLTGNLQ